MNSSNKTLDAAINKLIEKYPNGVFSSYSYRAYDRTPAKLLRHDEVKTILAAANNSSEQFKQLMLNHPACQELWKQQTDKLLINWFSQLNKSNNYRNNKITQKIKAREARERNLAEQRKKAAQRREELRAARALEAEKRRKEMEKAKAKAKRKAALWKKLDLSVDQKRILRQIAS